MIEIYLEFLDLFASLFTWPAIGFVLLGVLIGVVFGSIPGLGGPIAIALLIPITFAMDSSNAIILFGATLGGVAFGGSISAILLNIPGTAPNAATCLDGHPMTKQGRASEALSISATASALGAVFGLVVILAMIPFVRPFVLSFGPANIFWLAVFGLTVIASVSKGGLTKGLIAGGIGLLVSFIGYAGVHGTYRFSFGTQFLWDGIDVVAAIIGLFAIAEAIKLIASEDAIASTRVESDTGGGILRGVSQVVSRPGLFTRSSTIGVLVGLTPGAGGVVANFISYMYAKNNSDDPDSFGSGNPEGIIASEASNDAKDGGALLPTLAFGIPGSVTMAVLLGGLLVHGVTPGRELMENDLPLVLLIIAALLLSNLLASVFGLLFAKRLSTLTDIDGHLLAPAILTISVTGAFALRNAIGDVVIAVLFGIIGYLMISYSYSRIPIILALILGPIAEPAFFQAIQISGGDYRIFVSDPISLLLLGLTILSVILAVKNVGTSRIDREEVQ